MSNSNQGAMPTTFGSRIMISAAFICGTVLLSGCLGGSSTSGTPISIPFEVKEKERTAKVVSEIPKSDPLPDTDPAGTDTGVEGVIWSTALSNSDIFPFVKNDGSIDIGMKQGTIETEEPTDVAAIGTTKGKRIKATVKDQESIRGSVDAYVYSAGAQQTSTDFLLFGIGMFLDATADGGAYDDEFHAFVYGDVAKGVDNADSSGETATYSGGAVGVLADKTSGSEAVDAFTGNVSIDATFDPNGADNIEGSIDAIKVAGKSEPSSKITFNNVSKDLSDTGTNNFFKGTGSVSGTIGGHSFSSVKWSGMFFGKKESTGATVPGKVGGTFGAVSGNVSMVGSYGATKTN